MKGCNELILNEATMIAAVQFYFDAQFVEGKAPKVRSVKPHSNSGYATEFSVTTDDGATE